MNAQDAVVDGLALPWSSGVVENQVTRIKLIKRRSYGRASFALLRIRNGAVPVSAP